jgi:PAS domain S-box-containing protein
MESDMMTEDYRRYFDEIVDAIREGVLIVRKDGTIAMANAAMARMTGYAREELVGSTCTLLGCDACELVRSESDANWCKLFERERIEDKRCLLTRKDGSYVAMVKNACLLRNEVGRVVGALETYTDVSELDNRDIKIQELTRRLNGDHGFHGMVGLSRGMQQVYQLIEKAAASEATVLLTGESGTGKELVARAIHTAGPRKEGPYVKINCAALSEALIESELFGHTKGAFTGAYRHKMGLFETAHGGNVFLDEIGDMPLATQVKLLRVLETKEFIRIGGERTVAVDVRFIAATNQDLPRRVFNRAFREDLFFRLNVFPIHLPALRERKEDIALLVNAFVQGLRSGGGKRIGGVSSEVMDLFMRYDWPGNVRELKSALEYAFAVAPANIIEVPHLPARLAWMGEVAHEARGPEQRADGTENPREKIELIEALRRTGGNRSRAAKILGVHRMTVLNRIRKYNVEEKKRF